MGDSTIYYNFLFFVSEMLFTTWFGTDLFIAVERSKHITHVKRLPSLAAKMLDICDVNVIRLSSIACCAILRTFCLN